MISPDANSVDGQSIWEFKRDTQRSVKRLKLP